MMYKTLHVITSSSWGGLELYVASLISEQSKAGHRVSAYVMAGSPMEFELKRAGVTLHYANRSAHVSVVDIRRIRRIVREEQISVIHSHTSRDVWAGKFIRAWDGYCACLLGLCRGQAQARPAPLVYLPPS